MTQKQPITRRDVLNWIQRGLTWLWYQLFPFLIVVWLALIGFFFYWQADPAVVCSAIPTATQVPDVNQAPTVMKESDASQSTNTPTPETRIQCRNLLRGILPTFPTPTTDPRTTIEKITAGLNPTPDISKHTILIVQAAGPADWLSPGRTAKLIFVPVPANEAIAPVSATAASTAIATETPQTPSSTMAHTGNQTSDETADVIILRVDQPLANGLIPLLVAMENTDFERVKRVVGRSIAYPVYQTP